jgi:RNA polymerase sigma-70 factor (ECF subfamily)
VTQAPPTELAVAREKFLAVVDSLRPDLHRYVSRLVGSAIDGEDLVQDTLAKAFYAMSQQVELPPLRPWLFRIARNASIDFLRRYERKNASPLPEDDDMSDDETRDPEVMRAALASFAALPVQQRSAVILKDVLDESLADIAAHLDTSVEAVKALLVRGRRKLKEQARVNETAAAASPLDASRRALLSRYVELFNRRDWPAVQAMLIEECRLDLVSKSQRRGKAVGMYFDNYAKDTTAFFQVGRVEGRPAIGVFRGEPRKLDYVVLVELEGDRIAFIRDYRYVPYLARELEFVAG